jgi:transcription antitermination factor NusG
MNYNELSKSELLALVLKQVKELEDQSHLSEAINSKDREINELRQLKDQEITGLKNAYELEKKTNKLLNETIQSKAHLEQAVISKDKEIVELSKQAHELKVKTEPLPSMEAKIRQLEEENKKLVAFLNPYILNFRSTLKGLQGTLELAVELEALLSEKIAKK